MSAKASILASTTLASTTDQNLNLDRYQRVVIKVGSALLVGPDGLPRQEWLSSLGKDIAALSKAGKDVLIVTSGSIPMGAKLLKLKRNNLQLEEKQAAAALGMPLLMQAWQQALGQNGLQTAQILLTPHDTENRRRHLNARAAIFTLLDHHLIPIINENDTVATQEIRYGDNDRLAARVATMVAADLLILLSDVDGLYSANPHSQPDAQHIGVIDRITPQILAMAKGKGSDMSSGGMETKLQAAQIAMQGGTDMVITKGDQPSPIAALGAGARASLFQATTTPQAARKRWLLGSLKPCGKLILDQGALKALTQGNSLLPKGVVAVSGKFETGDPISLHLQADGPSLAIGLCAYSSEDTAKIIGKHSREIADILGYQGRAALIHRDDLALLDQ